jgi:hypothetical protein
VQWSRHYYAYIHGHEIDIENKVNFNRGGKVMLGYEWRKSIEEMRHEN